MEALAYREAPERKVIPPRPAGRINSRTRARTRNKTRILVKVILLATIFLFSMFYLFECIKGLNYRQESINYSIQLDQLDKQCKEVDAKIAALLDPRRLEKEAKRLGMVYPDLDRYRYKFLDLSKNRLSYYSD